MERLMAKLASLRRTAVRADVNELVDVGLCMSVFRDVTNGKGARFASPGGEANRFRFAWIEVVDRHGLVPIDSQHGEIADLSHLQISERRLARIANLNQLLKNLIDANVRWA
jgi:hypothetical protein